MEPVLGRRMAPARGFLAMTTIYRVIASPRVGVRTPPEDRLSEAISVTGASVLSVGFALPGTLIELDQDRVVDLAYRVGLQIFCRGRIQNLSGAHIKTCRMQRAFDRCTI